ncbi:MAG: efflux RND transporter periplasmic adaptor subunit [Planctomycetes bacterium]|nr:efflux RND transporter periplasmic adaptor subunit [Planctomycetota bacterium]
MTKSLMTNENDSVDGGWRQLEEFVDRLHELAHTPIETDAFYRRLLDGCVAALAATGGAVWLPNVRGRWELLHQTNLPHALSPENPTTEAAHYSLLQKVAASDEALIYPPRSGTVDARENPTDSVLVVSAVRSDASPSNEKPVAIIELFMRPGTSPAVQQGWQDMVSTVCHLAANYHTLDELRTLRGERGLHRQSLALLRRINQPTDLRRTVFEIANEGRSFVEGDRLSLVLRHGQSWRVAAVSGVDRIEARGDTARKLEQLADRTASWGEPIDSEDGESVGEKKSLEDDLPPELIHVIEQQRDVSHARRVVAVPIEFARDVDSQQSSVGPSSQPAAVLIAEQFSVSTSGFSRQRVVELAQLCEPALRQAIRLDRFPARLFLRWTDRWTRARQAWGVSRLAVAAMAVVAIVAALVFVKRDFEIEAPATLVPVVERDVFATANGTIVDVQVVHGEKVEAGAVLAVIDDPTLSLDSQRVLGEVETMRKRLEAIAVARTDRNVQADTDRERLPLSAEAQQLEKKLASLEKQREILAARRTALTLRSPIAGTVLTLDVQNLLRTRPVERGQVLFKVADVEAGWWLWAEVEQDRIGHVVAAQQASEGSLPTRFRFAGEDAEIFSGHVESISATAVLDPNELNEAAPALRVRVAVDEQSLPAARPGMTAKVRIQCGRRSLGYVWLHDAWETVYSWLVF